MSSYRTWLTRTLAAYGGVNVAYTAFRLATISCEAAARPEACSVAQTRGLYAASAIVFAVLVIPAVLHIFASNAGDSE